MEARTRGSTPLTLRAELGALVWEEWVLVWPQALAKPAPDIRGAWYSFKAPLEALEVEPLGGGIFVPDGEEQPFCISPERLELGFSPRRPERLLRQLSSSKAQSSQQASVGRLASLFVAWRQASADSMSLMIYKGQIVKELEGWLVEALCGRRWAKAERALSRRRSPDFGEMFARASLARRLGRDSACDELLTDEQQRSALRSLRSREWGRWASEHQEVLLHGELTSHLSESFDELCNHIYEDIGCSVEGAKLELDADIYTPLGKLDAAVDEAASRWAEARDLSPLLKRVLPRLQGQSLASLSHEGGPLVELVGSLTRWLKARERGIISWQTESVGALLSLFLHPETLTLDELITQALREAIADRAGAQAIRYSALRRGLRPLGG